MGIKGNQNMSSQIMLLLHKKKLSLFSSLLLKARCRFSFIRDHSRLLSAQRWRREYYITNSAKKHLSISVVVQLLSVVQLSVTPWTAACQASLSFTITQSSLRLLSTESVMPSKNKV